MSSTQQLGALAELHFQARCVERGVDCYVPVIDGMKSVDAVILLNGSFQRVQVKKARVSSQGPKDFKFVQATITGRRYRAYGDDEFDLFAFVCPELGRIWLIPRSDIKATETWGKSLAKLDELAAYEF